MDISEETISRIHKEAPLTDVHAHPSLKAFLFRRNLWRHYRSGSTFNPFSSRSDFKTLAKGGVGVLWAAHYLPERQLFKDCLLMKLASMLLVPVYKKLMSGSLMKRLQDMMNRFEDEIKRKPDKTELALSIEDVGRIQSLGKLAIVHAVEGAHVLEGDLGNLEILSKRGVAMLTLSHFYENGVAAQVDAMPKDMSVKKLCKFRFQTDGKPPLTAFGKALLDKMKEVRMIVDVTHCSPDARAEVFSEINLDRPIIATHVGVAEHNPDPYNLADDEIKHIAKTGGAVGVIFMTYWLDKEHPANGLESIWKTLEHVHNVTNSWDHIVLGSDFDGFTDPPDDIPDASHFGKITRKLLEGGLTEAEIKKILGENAQRVLRLGWR